MQNVPAWIQLAGGLVVSLLILGGVYADSQSSLNSIQQRLTTLEGHNRDDKYLSDRVLVLEQKEKEREKRDERYMKTQERLADAVQSLSVTVAKLDARLDGGG